MTSHASAPEGIEIHISVQTNPVVIWLLLWTILVANDPASSDVPASLISANSHQISKARLIAIGSDFLA